MPIVDVRNIPTVVEFAPENKVVEFTEEAVTAEVVVGPTVVEFSWGELIPEPGLSGGGVFEGRVYIRPDIPTLPTNSEAIDPDADYLMLWDASSDTHVKVLAQLGAGGIAEIPWATREETDEGILTDKALNPDVGAYAYDRFRHVGQHAAGKGTATVMLSPVSGVVTVNGALSNVFRLLLTNDVEMANPVNPVNGQTINIHLKQNPTGGHQITAWGSQWTFTNKINPELSAPGNSHDMLSCQWNEVDGKMHCSFLPNYGAGYVAPPPVPFEDFNFVNVGGGNELFRDIVDTNINIRTVVGAGDVSVTTVDDTVVVSYTAPAAIDLSPIPFLFLGNPADYPSFAAAKGLWAGTNIAFDSTVNPGYLTINNLTVGVPEGGTLGQVLTKFGSADHDMGWSDPSGGGGAGGYPAQLGYAGI